MAEEKFSIWLILDLFVNIITMLAVVTILANYFQGIKLLFFIVLFMLWAFRPVYLAWKNFKLPPKKKGKKIKINPTIMNCIFWIVFALGFVLFLNRTFIHILPNASWKVLLDHLVGGFLVTILFYIFMLGMFSFFQPHRKIEYQIKWFILASFVTFLGSFYWEGIVQNFRDVSQIMADCFGLLFAWIYFLIFRKMQTDNLNKLPNRIKSEDKP